MKSKAPYRIRKVGRTWRVERGDGAFAPGVIVGYARSWEDAMWFATQDPAYRPEKTCHLCGRGSGDLVYIRTFSGQTEWMHAYGDCLAEENL